MLSGWLLENSIKPARVAKEDSETAWLTSRAIDYLDQAGPAPWCLHLSYIKPHWPYIAVAPYHNMYSADDVIPVNRSDNECEDPHPVLGAFQNARVSQSFSRQDVRNAVIPAYMGLITEIDDQIGRLMAHLDATKQAENTMIVFTSDHGDYLGDHWLGEKELFHEASVHVPLIIADPSESGNATRGQTCSELVQAIDLLPTFVEYAGGEPANEWLEGRSLKSVIEGKDVSECSYVISEYDYSFKRARRVLKQPINDCRLTMIFDGRFKLIHAEGFRPMLYDLELDPNELVDSGDDPNYSEQIDRLSEILNSWYRQHHTKTTISEADTKNRENGDLRRGVFLGFWDQADMDEAVRLGSTGN